MCDHTGGRGLLQHRRFGVYFVKGSQFFIFNKSGRTKGVPLDHLKILGSVKRSFDDANWTDKTKFSDERLKNLVTGLLALLQILPVSYSESTQASQLKQQDTDTITPYLMYCDGKRNRLPHGGKGMNTGRKAARHFVFWLLLGLAAGVFLAAVLSCHEYQTMADITGAVLRSDSQ